MKLTVLILLTSFINNAFSYRCEITAQGLRQYELFKTVGMIDSLNLNLRECLKKVQKQCKSIQSDNDYESFKALKRESFDHIKKSSEFKRFYCENFKDAEVNFNPSRTCKSIKIPKDLQSCDAITNSKHEDFKTLKNMCNSLLSEQLKKKLIPNVKNKFKKTLATVIKNYKSLYSNRKNVVDILDSISSTTNFNYRLTDFIAGARERAFFSDCMDESSDKKPSWCKGEYIITPGGKAFLPPERLELVLSHEVGHIINRNYTPEKELNKILKKLKSTKHLGSKKLVRLKKTLHNETCADIHMARYSLRYLKSIPSLKSHFCHYKTSHQYDTDSHYLHPIHRQALLNCSFESLKP